MVGQARCFVLSLHLALTLTLFNHKPEGILTWVIENICMGSVHEQSRIGISNTAYSIELYLISHHFLNMIEEPWRENGERTWHKYCAIKFIKAVQQYWYFLNLTCHMGV